MWAATNLVLNVGGRYLPARFDKRRLRWCVRSFQRRCSIIYGWKIVSGGAYVPNHVKRRFSGCILGDGSVAYAKIIVRRRFPSTVSVQLARCTDQKIRPRACRYARLVDAYSERWSSAEKAPSTSTKAKFERLFSAAKSPSRAARRAHWLLLRPAPLRQVHRRGCSPGIVAGMSSRARGDVETGFSRDGCSGCATWRESERLKLQDGFHAECSHFQGSFNDWSMRCSLQRSPLDEMKILWCRSCSAAAKLVRG